MDLKGRTVLPGFIDAHQHLSIFSQVPLQLNLSVLQVQSVEKLLEIVQSEAKRLPRGEWIRGVLYDDTKMFGDRALIKEDLDSVAPYHPVIIIHVSYNWSIVNSEALRRGGIDEMTPDQKGRKIGRDSVTGRLTGQLFGTAFHSEAMSGGQAIVPPFEKGIRNRALIDAARIMNSVGITSTTDASCPPSYVTSYHALAVDRLLPLRINMLISYFWLEELEKLGLVGRWGSEWVRCTGIKLIIDGAIAGRTAALRGGYSQNPLDHGVLVFEDPEELNKLVGRIHRIGYQACMHANGDLAIEMALDAIERAQMEYPRSDSRHRIEHCTIINDRILNRMRSLRVMALPFGSYLWQHGEKLVPYFGRKRAEIMFAHKSFLDAGIRVAGSSDAPAGLHPPLLGVQCMVTRKTPSGEVIGANERISIEEALKMYTVYAAYASFEEKIKGSLAPGRLADMVVLSQDPCMVDPEEIGRIGIVMTILGGRVVYEQNKTASQK